VGLENDSVVFEIAQSRLDEERNLISD